MFPLFPFVAGIVAGGLGVHYWRSDKARAGARAALDSLTDSARSGLDVFRSSLAGDAAAKSAPGKKPAAGKAARPAGRKAARSAAPRKRATRQANKS